MTSQSATTLLAKQAAATADPHVRREVELAGLRIVPPLERSYAFALAKKIAGVKVLVAILNIAVVVFGDGRLDAMAWQPLTMSMIFLLYMGVSYLALRKNWVSLRVYRVTAPIVDTVFCGLLILGTDGYLSPFTLWLAMAIVTASFSSSERIVLSVTFLAFVIQVLICFVPQSVPLDLDGFVIRTCFLFGFGLVIASIGNHMAKQAAQLVAVDSFAVGSAVGESVATVSEALLSHLADDLNPRFLRLELDDGTTFTRGEIALGAVAKEYPVASGAERLGTLQVVSSGPITSDDDRFLHTMLDRYALVLRRLRATDDLRQSLAHEARLRLADELHDTHVQTLTAIDLRIEALFLRAKLDASTRKELQEMRSLARQSLADLREFISRGPIESTDDVGEIINVNSSNWKGEMDVRCDQGISLPRGSWQAIGLLIREGLANARKHAGADWAQFTLERKGGMCIAALQTNGASPELPLTRQGYGLTRVNAAVAGAGGRMFFSDRKEGGAVLSAVFEEMIA